MISWKFFAVGKNGALEEEKPGLNPGFSMTKRVTTGKLVPSPLSASVFCSVKWGNNKPHLKDFVIRVKHHIRVLVRGVCSLCAGSLSLENACSCQQLVLMPEGLRPIVY